MRDELINLSNILTLNNPNVEYKSITPILSNNRFYLEDAVSILINLIPPNSTLSDFVIGR